MDKNISTPSHDELVDALEARAKMPTPEEIQKFQEYVWTHAGDEVRESYIVEYSNFEKKLAVTFTPQPNEVVEKMWMQEYQIYEANLRSFIGKLERRKMALYRKYLQPVEMELLRTNVSAKEL